MANNFRLAAIKDLLGQQVGMMPQQEELSPAEAARGRREVEGFKEREPVQYQEIEAIKRGSERLKRLESLGVPPTHIRLIAGINIEDRLGRKLARAAGRATPERLEQVGLSQDDDRILRRVLGNMSDTKFNTRLFPVIQQIEYGKRNIAVPGLITPEEELRREGIRPEKITISDQEIDKIINANLGITPAPEELKKEEVDLASQKQQEVFDTQIFNTPLVLNEAQTAGKILNDADIAQIGVSGILNKFESQFGVNDPRTKMMAQMQSAYKQAGPQEQQAWEYAKRSFLKERQVSGKEERLIGEAKEIEESLFSLPMLLGMAVLGKISGRYDQVFSLAMNRVTQARAERMGLERAAVGRKAAQAGREEERQFRAGIGMQRADIKAQQQARKQVLSFSADELAKDIQALRDARMRIERTLMDQFNPLKEDERKQLTAQRTVLDSYIQNLTRLQPQVKAGIAQYPKEIKQKIDEFLK